MDVDLTDEDQLHEVYEFLRDNYVEDKDALFRFDYQKEFLQWALMVPDQYPDWVVGVRGGKKNKMFGFITGIPVKIRLHKRELKLVEINFLCVHKKLRTKRLAPVLIKEITRRVNLKNIFWAVYTSGSVLPRPFAECRYFHRSINVKKLIEIKFSHLPPGRSMGIQKKLLKLPD